MVHPHIELYTHVCTCSHVYVSYDRARAMLKKKTKKGKKKASSPTNTKKTEGGIEQPSGSARQRTAAASTVSKKQKVDNKKKAQKVSRNPNTQGAKGEKAEVQKKALRGTGKGRNGK